MSGSWGIPQEKTAKGYREWIADHTVPGATQEKWSTLDIGKGVKLKIKAQDFNASDVNSAAAVFDLARSLINAASQKIGVETWTAQMKDLVSRYFLIEPEALDTTNARQRIRQVISVTQAGLVGKITLKIADLDGTRATVPSSSPPFIEKHNLAVKKGWVVHVGLTEDGATYSRKDDVYAYGIRFDRRYLRGDTSQGQTAPSVTLRAKTLIHECTHRFANTKDHAYFKDDGLEVDPTELTPPAANETKKWLDNADSFGWFVVEVAAL